MMVEVKLLDRQVVLAAAKQFANIYRAAFSPAPYYSTEEEVQMFHRYLPRHIERDGFQCAAAYDPYTEEWVGMAYGYTSRPGQWWHNQITKQLSANQVATWFHESFEWVELAVVPAYQRMGLGSRLHDMLQATIPNTCAVLSTIQAETTAFHLYQRRGWQLIKRNFRFENTPKPFLILGLKLRLDEASTSGIDA